MKCISLFIATLTLLSASVHAADYVHVKTSWDINVTKQTYKNNDTKVSFGPAIAAFRLHEAKPAQADGSAQFIYHGKRGFITLYHDLRAVVGFGSPAAYVQAICGAMEKGNGKFDSKSFFSLRYESGGKSASGRGVVYHFVHSPELYGKQIWDEFGTVRIGEFYFSYRGSFVERRGLDDLAAFLRAIGIRKI
ncbi:MAG: hypothetical protein ABI992_08455 [Chthoniobacterales bacterium]